MYINPGVESQQFVVTVANPPGGKSEGNFLTIPREMATRGCTLFLGGLGDFIQGGILFK